LSDYSKYTLKQLNEKYQKIRKENPAEEGEDLALISAEISKRSSEAAGLIRIATDAFEMEHNPDLSIRFLKQVEREFPGTREQADASKFIKRIGIEKDHKIDSLKKSENQLELEFSATGREYFQVWIVNLCLTLVTLGVFSAWAKVRKKRYLYSNLILDGTPFQYLASPMPILRGRLVAAALFLLYYSSSHFYVSLLPYVLSIGAILAPWVMIRSIGFNCRYSAYRNLAFDFRGTYFQALKVLSAWGLIPGYVVGISFGFWGAPWLGAIIALGFVIYFPWWMKNIKTFTVNHTRYGGQAGAFYATGGSFFRVYAVAGLITIPFGILTGLLGFAVFGSLKGSPYLHYILSVPAYAGYVFAYAYMQANITNTVWKNIRLGPVFFHCRLKTMDLVKLYMTNAAGIIVSAGLLIPWAVIRTFRYRVEHTRIYRSGPMTGFEGDRRGSVSAAGAELVDFFDFDVSL
jgi:uncharacterized membrane protein YjgN (DUF898 family)